MNLSYSAQFHVILHPQLLGKHWFERNQLNVIRRNNILPLALRDAAREDLLKLPADSNTIRIRPR